MRAPAVAAKAAETAAKAVETAATATNEHPLKTVDQ
jgi:hypothetical protein